jgi:hypothetical protein
MAVARSSAGAIRAGVSRAAQLAALDRPQTNPLRAQRKAFAASRFIEGS